MSVWHTNQFEIKGSCISQASNIYHSKINSYIAPLVCNTIESYIVGSIIYLNSYYSRIIQSYSPELFPRVILGPSPEAAKEKHRIPPIRVMFPFRRALFMLKVVIIILI